MAPTFCFSKDGWTLKSKLRKKPTTIKQQKEQATAKMSNQTGGTNS